MGTWGSGNFEGDSPCDLRDTFVRDLVHRVGKLFRSKKLDLGKGEDELMPWFAILLAVCERCGGHPPRPNVISQWKQQYLDMFDAELADMAGDDFVAERRKVIKATFAKLERLSRQLYGDFTDDELPKPGAVFRCRLGDGRYGACRVLRIGVLDDDPYYGEPALLVAASSWIGSARVNLDDPQLREILCTNHHRKKKKLEMGWLSTPPPRSFKYLGEIPPSKKEQELGPPVFLRDWTVLPEQILLQWRWDHDRDALLAEEAANKSG